jgi:hypothetical protein
MHAAVRFARELFFGTDGRSLFVRVDPFEPGGLFGTTIAVRTPVASSAVFQSVAGGSAGDLVTVLDRVLEMSIPLDRLAATGAPVRFAIEIRNGEGSTQRIPADGFVELARPEHDPSRFDWSV